jgi:hypothetical protein
MLETPPLLGYSTPVRRNRLRTFAAVVLLLWAVFDFVCGLLMLLPVPVLVFLSPHVIGLLFLALAVTVVWFGISAHVGALDILHHHPGAAWQARRQTRVAEVLCWIGFGTALCFSSGRFRDWAPNLLWLVIPGAVSFTRWLLTRVIIQETQELNMARDCSSKTA